MAGDRGRDAGYAAAIAAVLQNHRTYAVLCGAPLVALLTQLQWLQSIDSLIIKLMLTVSVVCLFIAGALVVVFIDMGYYYLAKVCLSNDESPRESPFVEYTEKLYRKAGVELDEASITRIAMKLEGPLMVMIFVGWLLLLSSLFSLLWLPDS
ncbi:MAG: hypothetical protein U1E59_08450 [Amaricoccus sp.]